MISLSKLLYAYSSFGDELRYVKRTNYSRCRPIVVWNVSRRCNLSCIHCYSDSSLRNYRRELTTGEAKKMIEDLADFGVPVLLFSGGEPILRKDLFILNTFAKKRGLRTVISTNGTLINKSIASRIKENKFDYVGVSLDGVGQDNDYFRGKKGAFRQALSGIRNLVDAGQKVGLRFTLTRHNYRQLPKIFKLAEEEKINRICFYHLVYVGRASNMRQDGLAHSQTRRCLDSICDWVMSLAKRGIDKEILTVDNHADGPYIYLKMKKKNPKEAEKILELLRYNAGNSSGIGIANIDNLGFVHPDQFWQSCSFGNVRNRKFSAIWQDIKNPVMRGLKNRKSYLKGRCARCRFLDICNGNFRVRAEVVYHDIWQEDPACYLTDRELKC